jgi:diguanylate cyclase (GGDEF)-like protein
MISIKKYLDLNLDKSNKQQAASPDELLAATLKAYRAVLLAVADHAVRACPASSRELQAGLKKIEQEFPRNLTSASLNESEVHTEEQLHLWSSLTVQHLKQKAEDVREILLVLAKAGEDACERDQRYSGKFYEITQQLNSIAHLDDISQVRAMVMKSAAALKNSIVKMTEDGKEAMAQLRAQVSSYQSRIEQAERLAFRDCLTGLRSRLNVEAQIERRIEEKRIFSLIMIDLDGFKQVNDTHGHAAGDDLLKQFADELSSASRSTDVVGRWGGDEFLIIVDAPMCDAQLRVQRLKEWVCGEYVLDVQGVKEQVELGASIGVVESELNDTAADIINRADGAMYREKKATQNGKES